MSILDKLEKLNFLSKNHRGAVEQSTLDYIDQTHEQINSNQAMKELAHTKGMIMLLTEMRGWLADVDSRLMSTETKIEDKRDLLAYKRAYTDVLKLVSGADSRLEAIEKAIDYQLGESDG